MILSHDLNALLVFWVFFSTSVDGTICLWNVGENGSRLLKTFEKRSGAFDGGIEFSPNGKFLASFSQSDGSLRIWNIAVSFEYIINFYDRQYLCLVSVTDA